MLAKVAPPSNDFQALARYLVSGKTRTPDPKRVAWCFGQNLPTDDPLIAASYMAATAQQSARTRAACYHLMIAWHATERPKPQAMQMIARETLRLAGLAEHQALVMGHGDKPHPHLHIMLNRVHPGTGRAWTTSHDFALFDRIMHELADAHGFTIAPAHAFQPEDTHALPKLPNTPATYAGRRGAPTLRPQWSKDEAKALGAALSEDLTMASTPQDVADLVAQHGLTLEAKGKGHVVGDAFGYAKLSSLGLTASAKQLLRAASTVPRHAPFLEATSPNRRAVFAVDAVDIARALQSFGLLSKDDVQAAVDDAKASRRAHIQNATGRSHHTQLAATMLTPPPAPRMQRLSSRLHAAGHRAGR